jgi:hypothetical protein
MNLIDREHPQKQNIEKDSFVQRISHDVFFIPNNTSNEAECKHFYIKFL